VVWPTNVDLLSFNADVVIAVIFQQLFDGVREQMNELKNAMLDEKSLLTVKMNELLAWFEEYRAEVQINDDFARYFVVTHSGPSRGRKGGKFPRAPRRLGARRRSKILNMVLDGFFSDLKYV